MATLPFADTFTQTNGTAPAADWSVVSGQATIQANALRVVPPATGTYATGRVDLAGMPVTGDTDVTGTVVRDASGVEQYAVIGINSDGTSNLQADSGNNSYALIVNYQTQQAQLRTSVGGTTTTQVSAGFTLTGTTTYSFRLQRLGTALRAKVWTTTEPTAWTVSYVLTGTLLAGKVTLAAVNGGNATQRPATFDSVTVADPVASASTVAADSFTRADSTTLGSTETGGFIWQTTNAGYSIVSNVLRWAGSTAEAAVVNTGKADDWAIRFTVRALEGTYPVAFAFGSGASNGAVTKVYRDNSAGAWKAVGPVLGTVSAAASPNPVVGDVFELRKSGTTLTLFRNLAQVGQWTGWTVNNTASDTYQGIGSGGTVLDVDDFGIYQPAAPPAVTATTLTTTGTTSVGVTASGSMTATGVTSGTVGATIAAAGSAARTATVTGADGVTVGATGNVVETITASGVAGIGVASTGSVTSQTVHAASGVAGIGVASSGSAARTTVAVGAAGLAVSASGAAVAVFVVTTNAVTPDGVAIVASGSATRTMTTSGGSTITVTASGGVMMPWRDITLAGARVSGRPLTGAVTGRQLTVRGSI